MNRSLRWRLQGWYAVVLLAVVGGFASLLYAEVRAAQFQKIDAALSAVRPVHRCPDRRIPPHEWDGGRPEDRPPPDEPRGGFGPGPPPDGFGDRPPDQGGPFDRPPGRRGPPPRQNRERVLNELGLPVRPSGVAVVRPISPFAQ